MITFCVRSIGILAPLLSSFYIFSKSIKYKASKLHIVLAVIWSFVWAVLYGIAAVTPIIPLSIIRPIACLTSVVFVFLITRYELGKQQDLKPGQIFEITTAAYLLSFGISSVLNYIAMLPVFVPSMFLLSSETVVDTPLDLNQPIYLLLYTLTLIIQLILSFLLFKIKRFKNGFPFILKKYTIVVSLLFTGVVIALVTGVNMLSMSEENRVELTLTRYLFVADVIIIGGGICILLIKLIKAYQKMVIQQHSENQFEKLYLKEKEEHAQTKKQLEDLRKAKSSALHSIEDRLNAFQEALDKSTATQDDFKNLDNAWQDELDKMKENKHLKSTRVNGLDILFSYYENQFTNENIIFTLMLDGNIRYMVDNVLKQSQFETLISNHLNDARIAVNASDHTYRHITAMISFEDYYEFTVFDSGIPFEVDTLIRLGTERVTTHADTGGSGIGFETTFEIMREHNASLIIKEFEESNTGFSKSITIRFDGKGQYIIETYRPGNFPANKRYNVIGR